MNVITATTSNESLSSSLVKKSPNQFIECLYSLIENQQYSHLISWTENDNSFTIHKPHIFSQVLLPSLCKHSNLDSFIRQLNMYCFKKCKSKAHSDAISYWHPCFVKGQPELLINVIRKNPRRILKQKEAQLRGLGNEEKSTSSSNSRVQYTNTPVPAATKNTQSQAETEINTIYNYFMQSMPNLNLKCDKSTMSMIRSYLNDDDEEENDQFSNYFTDYEPSYGYAPSKKIKYSPESSGQGSTQYVQMDFTTMNFTPFVSDQTKEALNAQMPRTTQVFNGRDYTRCVNNNFHAIED